MVPSDQSTGIGPFSAAQNLASCPGFTLMAKAKLLPSNRATVFIFSEINHCFYINAIQRTRKKTRP